MRKATVEKVLAGIANAIENFKKDCGAQGLVRDKEEPEFHTFPQQQVQRFVWRAT